MLLDEIRRLVKAKGRWRFGAPTAGQAKMWQTAALREAPLLKAFLSMSQHGGKSFYAGAKRYYLSLRQQSEIEFSAEPQHCVPFNPSLLP